MDMKKVVIVGGAGTVGRRIANGIKDKFDVVIMDMSVSQNEGCQFIKTDATNFEELQSNLPQNTYCIINLLKADTNYVIEEWKTFEKMTDVFFKATYNILMAAQSNNVPKVIFASSNHVTDHYENEGYSVLGREINIDEYPYMNGLYGVLKLASEQLGFIFSKNTDVSVINIRIGSVPPHIEQNDLEPSKRLYRTLLTDEDVVQIFEAAIKSKVQYGTYYGVSDNPDKPWNTENAVKELGFKSIKNSKDYSRID